MNYVTLHQVKTYLDILSSTQDDERLLEFIDWSSLLIDAYKQRWFEPRMETRKFDLPGARRGFTFGVYDPFFAPAFMPAALRLDAELLECTELLNGDASEILAGEYVLEPANEYPKTRIRLRSAAGVAWQPDEDNNIEQVIWVSGVWGNHNRYGQAWVDSLDTVQDDPLAEDATTLTVADWDGAAAALKAPRFQAGQLLRIWEELLLVLSAATLPGETEEDPSVDQLEVVRGTNGSLAAEHAQGTKIEIWRPMGTIVQACLRLVKWRYGQKDVDDFDKSYAVGTGIVTVPSRLPADVVQVLGAPGKARL